jgi:hypothetical protein
VLYLQSIAMVQGRGAELLQPGVCQENTALREVDKELM